MSTRTEKNSPQNAAGAPGRILYTAAAILDSRGDRGRALLIEFGQTPLPRILASGTQMEVADHPAAARAERVDLPDSLIIPGLVNAHTHLDLTHIGPLPHDPAAGFITWIDTIRSRRCLDAPAVEASIARGAELCLAGGTVAVGDIAGTIPGDELLTPWRALATTGLLGISYQEFFAIGNRCQAGRDRLTALTEQIAAARADAKPANQSRLGPRLGLQPHAPYTVDVQVYLEAAAHATRLGLPLATHLAETPEEQQLVRRGQGPFRQLLETAGIWDESILQHLGKDLHPVQHLAPALNEAHFLVAHINSADDAAIETLAATDTAVAYCPRASGYFGVHTHFGPHRYRDMVSAGITVALGTDSIVNLPPTAHDPGRGGISILDEMRLLHQRDATDPLLLLQMATTNGARALRLPEEWFLFEPETELAGLLAVPLKPSMAHSLAKTPGHGVKALATVLQGNAAPILLFAGNGSRETRKTATTQAPHV